MTSEANALPSEANALPSEATYFDRLPADINRLIEEYSSREILLTECKDGNPHGERYIFFTLVIPGPITISLPFIVTPNNLRYWTRSENYTDLDDDHDSLADVMGISIRLDKRGDTIVLRGLNADIIVFNPRISKILHRKLCHLARDCLTS